MAAHARGMPTEVSKQIPCCRTGAAPYRAGPWWLCPDAFPQAPPQGARRPNGWKHGTRVTHITPQPPGRPSTACARCAQMQVLSHSARFPLQIHTLLIAARAQRISGRRPEETCHDIPPQTAGHDAPGATPAPARPSTPPRIRSSKRVASAHPCASSGPCLQSVRRCFSNQ